MHHLTNHYRHMAEQLQEKVNFLERQLLEKSNRLLSEDLQWNMGAKLPTEEEMFMQKMAKAEEEQMRQSRATGPQSSNRIQLAANVMRMLNDPDHPVHQDETRKQQLISLLAFLNSGQGQPQPPEEEPPTTGSQPY